MSKKKQQSKPKLHPRNKNKERYDLDALVASFPPLSDFVKPNVHGDDSIDFANPVAVKALNKAILKHHYAIAYWDIPEGYLVPPIPGRADYIHHIADHLRNNNYGKIPTGKGFRVADIGVGANCIYPIVGSTEYGWSFIGADIDETAIASAQEIVSKNEGLSQLVEIRKQDDPKDFFYGVLQKDEWIDLTVCNPPFHESEAAANKGSLRKVKNLTHKKTKTVQLNFGGQSNELIYKGGEDRFVGNMIRQSKKFGENVFWFSTLVSKATLLDKFNAILKEVAAEEVAVIEMGQGNKTSRILVWTFLSKAEQNAWKNGKWNESKS